MREVTGKWYFTDSIDNAQLKYLSKDKPKTLFMNYSKFEPATVQHKLMIYY